MRACHKSTLNVDIECMIREHFPSVQLSDVGEYHIPKALLEEIILKYEEVKDNALHYAHLQRHRQGGSRTP